MKIMFKIIITTTEFGNFEYMVQDITPESAIKTGLKKMTATKITEPIEIVEIKAIPIIKIYSNGVHKII